jgi:lipopolysaccharide transport system permease protein
MQHPLAILGASSREENLYSPSESGVHPAMSQSKSSPTESPAPRRFAPDLWRHRQLLWQFTLRNVELRHRGSHLGLVWSVFNPLLMLGLYVLVFGYVFDGHFNAAHPESRMEYALGIFLGLTTFHLFAEVLGAAPGVIVANPNFVKRVVFPLEILPAANVGASLFHALISLSLALLGVALLGPGLTFHALWLPVVFLPLLFLLLGVAWLISAAGVFFRDIGQITGFVTMVLMYASCVFFSSAMLPAKAWAILRFNPLLLAVELVRDSVLWHTPINLLHLSYLYGCGLLLCALGYWCFRRAAPAFADVL